MITQSEDSKSEDKAEKINIDKSVKLNFNLLMKKRTNQKMAIEKSIKRNPIINRQDSLQTSPP